MPDDGQPPEIRLSPPRVGRGWMLINWLPVASLLLPAAMLALAGWLTWREALADAFRQIARSAEAAAEYGDRALDSYVVAADRVNDRLRGLTEAQIRAQEATLHRELARQLSEIRSDAWSFAIDRRGVPLVGSVTFPIEQNSITEREYFAVMAPAGRPAVYISPLFVGWTTNRLQFVVARPREGSGDPPDANGFEGIAFVTVDPEVLAGSMRRLVSEPDYLGLVLLGGETIARTAGAQILPPVAPTSPFFTYVANGEAAATYFGLNRVDGSQVLTALRRLDRYPVYAAALRPRASVVAAWQETMLSHLVFGVPATLALFILSLLIRAKQLRLAAANVALRVDMRRNETRLTRAERLGLFGSFEIDLRTGENFRSAEYMAVQGHPAAPRMESHLHWVRRLHPDDRERAEGMMLAAVAPGSTATEYAQTYRIITPKGGVKWIAARAEIERDADGLALAMRGAHVDVTSLREAERALADSDARLRLAQEAAGIGTWEWQASGETRLSGRMLDLWGFARDGGQPDIDEILQRIHPEDRARIRQDTKDALLSGLLQTECRVVRASAGGDDNVIWVMLRASAQHDGQGPRLIGIGYDVSDRKLAEAEAALLAQEVEHRARNALAVVTGLLSVTKAETVGRFAEVMTQRVQALSGTMSLLGRNRFRGADLRSVLEHELLPYGEAVTLEGETVLLPADLAQPLSMALHELATNAAKYGALSVPGGRLRVSWELRDDELRMQWEERGGPPLATAPSHSGFGSNLITQTIAGALDGDIERDWRPEGLFCSLRLRLRQAQRIAG